MLNSSGPADAQECASTLRTVAQGQSLGSVGSPRRPRCRPVSVSAAWRSGSQTPQLTGATYGTNKPNTGPTIGSWDTMLRGGLSGAAYRSRFGREARSDCGRTRLLPFSAGLLVLFNVFCPAAFTGRSGLSSSEVALTCAFVSFVAALGSLSIS